MTDLHTIIEQHIDEINRLGLRIYQPAFGSDYLFLRWWLTLNETGDIEKLIIKGSRKLSAFFTIFAPPTITLYTCCPRTGEIDFVMWLRPASSAPEEQTVFASMWVSKQVRGKRRHYDLAHLTYTLIFNIWPAILGTTWQPDLLAIHSKLGYDVIGTLPNTYGQEMVYIVQLTKEKFENSRFYLTGKRRKK